MSSRNVLVLSACLAWLGCASDPSDPGTVDTSQQTGQAQAGSPQSSPPLTSSTDGGPVRALSNGGSGSPSRSKDAGLGGLDAAAQPMPGDGGSDAAASSAYSCTQASDCVVKDVGSCCGYNPRCANLGATFAAPNCSNGQVGVCGFPIIDHCECQQDTCVSIQAAVQGSQF